MMSVRSGWILACLLLAAGCAGGGTEPPPAANNGGTNNGFQGECQRDVDCGLNQVCNEGACQDASCQRDADCDVGFFCQLDSGECVSPECLRNSECGAGEYCDRVERKCKSGCGDNSDCGDNEVCNPNTNACEQNNECTRDGDCDEREVCLEDKCVAVECVADSQCDTGEVCDPQTNKCVAAEGFCDADSDCAQGEKCDLDANVCVEVAGCTDATCPQGTFCNEPTGECWECGSDDDCREGEDDETAECNLTTHTCVESRCQSDADCGAGEICDRVSGACEQQAACQPDSFEPNDARDAASAIGDGTFTGLRVCEGDVDWYAFQVGAGDSLEINLGFTHAQGNLDMELLDPNNERFGVSTSNSDNERIFAENLPLSGTYRLRVFGVEGASNDYSLQVTLQQGQNQTCTDDGFEENDAAAAAAPITAQSFDNLTVCPGDPDYFKVRVEAGERLSVMATFAQANGDLDLTVLSPDGGTVLGRGLTNTDNEVVVTEPVMVSGDYVIVVAGVDPSVGNSYGLAVSKMGEPMGSDCADDQSEPNDARDQAATIAPGLIEGLQTCPGDEDWYAIGLNAGDDIRVEIDFTHADGDLDMVLFQPDNPEPISASRSQSDGEQVSFTDVPVSGVYLVRVAGASPAAENSYLMLVERTEVINETCQDDNLEDNDNNTQPRVIQEGVLEGQICSGDEDWFSVHVNAGAALDVLLAPGGDGDLDMEVFSPGGQSLGVSSNAFGDEELNVVALTSGRHLIRVFGFLGSEDAYELLTTLGEAPCDDDASEENDARVDAELVDFGTLSNRFVCSNDDDWYAVELNPNDGLTATAFFRGAQADIDVAIHNEAGQILALSTSVSDNEEATIGSVVEGGLYYVRVYGFRGASAPYDLELTRIDGGTTCVDDSQEPNDSRERARAVTAPRDLNFLQLCPRDDDWFAFEVQEREVIDVAATFTHADGDVDIEVRDANGAIIARGYSVTDDEAVLVRAQTAGTYYVRAFSFNTTIDAEYALSIDILPPETCVDDDFEENDTRETAARVFEGIQTNLGICKPADDDEDDWYAVTLSELDILTVTILFEHDVVDLDMEIFAPSGARVGRSASRRDTEEVELLAEESGLYLIRVYPYFLLPFFDDANSEYDMIVTID